MDNLDNSDRNFVICLLYISNSVWIIGSIVARNSLCGHLLMWIGMSSYVELNSDNLNTNATWNAKSRLCRHSQKSKSSLCDEGLITKLHSPISPVVCPHWDAQATNLSHSFSPPRFRNSIGCNCSAIMITAGATTFSLIENRKIQLNAISPRCQTNTGDL